VVGWGKAPTLTTIQAVKKKISFYLPFSQKKIYKKFLLCLLSKKEKEAEQKKILSNSNNTC
jgi:hypothetical protein